MSPQRRRHILPKTAPLGADTNTNCDSGHLSCFDEDTHKQDLPRTKKGEARQARPFPDWSTSSSHLEASLPRLESVYDWKQRCFRSAAEQACVKKRGSELQGDRDRKLTTLASALPRTAGEKDAACRCAPTPTPAWSATMLAA